MITTPKRTLGRRKIVAAEVEYAFYAWGKDTVSLFDKLETRD